MISLFDAHCDTIYLNYTQGTRLLAENPNGHLDLKRTEQAFSPYAQFFAFFADAKGKSEAQLARVFREQSTLWEAMCAENAARIALCRSAGEARAAFARGKAAAFLSVEGAELAGKDLRGLEAAFELGVRAVNLTWNRANALSGSCAEDAGRGLSCLGRSYVARMNSLGVLVDVSHLSDAGFWDVIRMAKQALMASHSNARALHPHPRNLTDDQFRAIRDGGGVVGLNLYSGFLGEDAEFETLRRHLDHFLSLGGEMHLALGGDWDGCDLLPNGFENGISGLAGFYQYLREKHYDEGLLAQLYFKNLMRVVEDVCVI